MDNATTQTNAVQTAKRAKPPTLRDHLESDEFKMQVARALPKHCTPERFIRVACTAMLRNPKLEECDQRSFFQACLSLSQYGLEPDGRRAHLIPFNNRKRNIVECQLIIDYKGLVELIMRSGLVSNLHADVVRENDDFAWDMGQIVRHMIDWRKPRGDVYAVYAVCLLKDGTKKCEVMTREDVEKIRARSLSNQNGPWVTDWEEMAKKTVFRRLSKWLTLSPELRDAVEIDDELPNVDPVARAKPAKHASVAQLFEGDPVAEEPPTPPTASPALELHPVAEKLAAAKVQFDDFSQWLETTGHYKGDRSAWSGYADVPHEVYESLTVEAVKACIKIYGSK